MRIRKTRCAHCRKRRKLFSGTKLCLKCWNKAYDRWQARPWV